MENIAKRELTVKVNDGTIKLELVVTTDSDLITDEVIDKSISSILTSLKKEVDGELV